MSHSDINNNSCNSLNTLFNEKRAEIMDSTEKELDLFEFGLFLAARGKTKLDRAVADQKLVRKLGEKKRKDFLEIDEMAEKF